VRVIKGSTSDQPFFLYVAFNAPHLPLQATGESLNPAPQEWADMENYSKGRDVELYRQIYAAMVGSLDNNIGKILTAIDASGLRANTLVFFLSDNGGDIAYAPSDNSPFRGGKGTVWEGGVRTPAIIRWPASLPGGARIAEPMSYVDVFPTIAEIAGLISPPAQDLDGVSVLRVLAGKQRELDRRIYLGEGAMVDANWKIIADKLFAIKTDPGETMDIATSHQDVVRKFQAEVKQVEVH
jgi:arylsulfatase B